MYTHPGKRCQEVYQAGDWCVYWEAEDCIRNTHWGQASGILPETMAAVSIS